MPRVVSWRYSDLLPEYHPLVVLCVRLYVDQSILAEPEGVFDKLT
jgi:hypothetical protein